MDKPGYHREEATGFYGQRFSYIVLDPTPVPRLVDATKVILIGKKHKPISGRCMGCTDTMVTETNTIVEHTTWGEVFETSVCSTCAEKATASLRSRRKRK
jgi:hypothetical protein